MRCAEKNQYASMAEAETACRKAKRQPNKGHALRRLNAYHCPECGWYHVGHYAARVKQTPVEAKQEPTFAELRRQLNKRIREWERHDDRMRRRKAMEILNRVAAESESEPANEQYAAMFTDLADLADSIAVAARMTAELLGASRNTR